jgi:hypothetical protein
VLPILLLLAVGVVAGVVAWLLQRRTAAEPERGPSWHVPNLIDRRHFERPEAEWLVAVFSSSTCLACASTWDKAALLESEVVAVQEVEAIERKDLHDRYGVDAVPLVLIADAAGSVRRSFVGPPTATDLWAALAELREPGSVPPGCTGDGH